MADHEVCSNCRREIPQQNFRMHSLHCARNISLCTQCDEPIPINELQAHRDEVHGMEACSLCGEQVEACKMENHQSDTCAKQTTLCTYCATHVEKGALQDHENYCGSRTDKCKDCGEFIMLKNFDLHIKSNHGFIKLDDEPGPKPSWEKPATKPAVSTTSASTSVSAYSRFSKYTEPTPSTPTQRANFTATELFNNQDLYSSRRFSSSSTSTSSSLLKSSSSSVVASSLTKSSTSSSIVNKALNGELRSSGVVPSKSTSLVPSMHEDAEVEKLPCEFCEAMIPMFKLLSHQAECVNPSNIRENGALQRSTSTSSYRAYSSLRRDSTLNRDSGSSLRGDSTRDSGSSLRRDSTLNRETGSFRESYKDPTTTLRETSVSRSSSLNTGTSMASKYLRQSSIETPPSSLSSHSSNGNNVGTPRKISPNSSSIVSRYITSPEPAAPNSSGSRWITDSPPSYEKTSEVSVYMGRSSYLMGREKEESKKVEKKPYESKPSAAPGMYENDADRENLRQMLSGLRRDPMDVEEDPDNNDGSFFPCEFCGDPYPSEFIMRHQMSCDLNPRPVSSGNGFDYNQIKNSIARNLGIEPPPTQQRKPSPEEQRHLSRSSSVRESTYSRTGRASSISRTSSFADRSYGTRTSLARKSSFSIADYSSAVRRSSVFDGYAGYSIYSSISDGLDQITYGGRASRRNSVTDMTYSFSRRGSVSGGTGTSSSAAPLPALMAALDASKASQEERKEKPSSTSVANAHINGQASAYLSTVNAYSRQSSSNDSPQAMDSPFGIVNGHHKDLQRSDSKVMSRRLSTVKHSQSGHKLERKVSFHSVDQIIARDTVDDNGQPIDRPDKPKRKKERTEEEKAARKEKKERKEKKRMERGMSKDRKPKEIKQHPSGGDLMDQVSAKLQVIEREQINRDLGPVPSSSLLSASLSHQVPTSSLNPQASNPANLASPTTNSNLTNNGHLSTEADDNKLTVNPPQEDLVNLEEVSNVAESVTLRDQEGRGGSKVGSKRNSLDNKSVQSLAKDLAAECAKAYELMESSLSKLTNDFSIGPFGLTPKNKKKYRAPQPPPLK